MALTFPRRWFFQAATAMAIAPTVMPAAAIAGDARGPAPGRPVRHRSKKHAVYRAPVFSQFRPMGIADQPSVFAGGAVLLAGKLSLKRATRRCHQFNRQQLAGGLPRQWAFVVAMCREEQEVRHEL